MFEVKSFGRVAVSLLALAAATPALAQQAPQPSTPSLLEAMVASGVITQAQADKILQDARARDIAKGIAQDAPRTAQSAPVPPANDGALHVQYVPEVVKKQLREEIKQEVMTQAKDEGWAAPNQTPEWTQRIRFSGDVRTRFEEDMYPHGNALGSLDMTNFNTLNTASAPIDLTKVSAGTTLLPSYNANEDRTRARLRARLGVDADVGEDFTTGMRLATGADNSPVSTNQTLGSSGGNFSKYSLWLDRAFIKYEPFNTAEYGLSATVGRLDNPFFSTSMIWADDLGFDGVAVKGRYQLVDNVTPFITMGAFPVYNTDLNFATTESTKFASNDKWLYALQAGSDWKAAPDLNFKGGVAYYYFNNIAGKQQTCQYLDLDCASDATRPSFAQKGNTYIDLRNNVGGTSPSTDPNYQYFGLATGFHELALTQRVDYDGLKPLFDGRPLRVSLDGEFVKNLAFNMANIRNKSPENNVPARACASTDTACLAAGNAAYNGGDTGYMARLTVGSPALKERWDWNVSLAYKYIESDAVVDAFVDPDFGMGGTNLKGYIAAVNLAVAKNVSTSLRWMSADSIAGLTPYSEDTIMLDLNAKF
jgi:hypothetical protein